MKLLLGVLFTLNVFGLIANAQGLPPPPPPPLIYEVPEKNIIQEYVAPDKSFKADFPGKPQIKDQKLITNPSFSYGTYLKGSNSVVLVNEFEVNTEDKLNNVYESVKNGLLKQNFKFVNEKDIKNDGISGKEFSATNVYTFQRGRIFAHGKKVFIVFKDVTNWHILNQHFKEKVEEFNKETDRFFSSFKILN